MVDFRRILPPDMEMGPNPSSLAGEFLSTLAEEKKQDTQQVEKCTFANLVAKIMKFSVVLVVQGELFQDRKTFI